MDHAALTPPDTSDPQRLPGCPAPSKLNLFLHVVGRRADGYHLLQTAFRLLDWGDTLDFTLRGDGEIHRTTEVPGVPAEQDLVMRAARLLQAHTGCRLGADIALHKVLPMGGGIGGGSSDAATTLIALNRLWGTGLGRAELQALGLQLGADVPVFIFGRDAFAEGVGEALQPMALAPAWYVLVSPGVAVPTAEIFCAKDLTRDTPPIRMADFAACTTRNDLQPVACKLYPEVQSAVDWLMQHAPARMTGSGACVFAEAPSAQDAERIAASCPQRWSAWKVRSASRHPLYEWLE
ncbi:4-(cytidine 5'-diphospho)-2-C-methyl-D-erythritol kinase [Thauera linaloolentis]|uniref:4-diphosphocytidyl-2-C-methyl-D-erythritol kinase n=1 Tax=Thauera linaloolentis (strain DSM 12138 / JCM 21573 / CCUG 41526 / CIP 105981 / IAM 15112 / NBRC 102519 / 47Lol) TaxID=1123367 RepID=N6ZAB5_THAL4|nr:4-(cytidine 5'-diphospho)-2-C-methyl-D-erythritol kinase [Thauera linaloolentis]ENO89129.1 4-diphosphocytidyl-2-C-methyl-D-erythritol kinase [Thauera linaloolentis 47Lol = DSM 12138]MCM8565724.1 4-(cytidine 5'-diphospho)-2-C-methyl-D-erythritol kinase [Thauera linaloolentis]